MEEIVKAKIAALTKQAKESGFKADATSDCPSSLHKIINTREKADAFMTLLYALQSKKN